MEMIQAKIVGMNGNYNSGRNTVTNSRASQQNVYGCLRRLRHGIPLNYRNEILQLSKLAGPLLICQLLTFLVPFVSTAFCGHLGKTELAAVSLAIAVINVTGISVGCGLASVCYTLISQTFGSRNLKRVGVILQRAILILLLACCPCWALLINTESIVLAVKQTPEVARLSQMYVEIFMPALPASFLYQLQAGYLQSQGILWPQIFTGIVGNVLNALINYIFLFVLDLGVVGSAAANAITQYWLALFLFAYILYKGLHKSTWAGWSVECLQEWGSFVSLAIPSMFMTCLEWWLFEIGGFLAGLISEVELGSQSTVNGIAGISYVFPYGFGVAASVRVGNALGAGDAKQAHLSSKVCIICTVVTGFCVALTIGISKDVISLVFTSDQQIRRRVAEVLVLFAPFNLFDATACATGGILKGAAKQKIAAVCSLVGYYCLGYPIGMSLMFAANLGITGLWTGLLICVFLQTCFFLTIILKLDWTKAAIEARVRAGVQTTEESVQPQAMEMQGGCHEITLDNHEEGHNSELEVLLERDSGTLTTVGEVLTFRQLCLRRGLALCSMLVLLAAGILTNMLLPAVFTSGLNETSTVPPTVDNLWTRNTMDQTGQV